MTPTFGPRLWAGLDIGSFSVKLVASAGERGARRVWAESVLPPIADGEDGRRDPQVVATALADCLSQLRLAPRGLKGITVGISGPDLFVKQISLPLVDEAEVGSALRFEARRHLPFDPQTMTIDYQILGRYVSERRSDVLLAAVSNEHLDRHLAPLAAVEMEPDIVDAAPLALTNALVDALGPVERSAVLLDIGHLASHLSVFQRGEPFFTRRLDFGGRSLTRAIARELQVSFDEAEEWKLAAGSHASGLQVDWGTREMRAVQTALQNELADELRRSFAFYRTLSPLPDPLKLHLSGGTARLPGLAARLSEILGIGVTVFDPLLEAAGEPGPQFAQSWGLAMRSA
jgi:type IV pilus assembly protein PilM